MDVLLKIIILLCLTQNCMPFGGLPGSDIRASRAPISCFQPTSETKRYSSSSSASSNNSSSNTLNDEDADIINEDNNQLQQNTKYINGLLETLDDLLGKYIVTGTMATVR